MDEYLKYNDLLIELRSLLFSGKEFDDNFVMFFKNRYRVKIDEKIDEKKKNDILDRLIVRAKNDFIKLPSQEIQFSDIKELLELTNIINDQFLIKDQADKYSASRVAFCKLNDQFRKGIYDTNEIKAIVTIFEKDAKALELIDKQYRLFEQLRNYVKRCETLIIPAKGDTRLLLSPDLNKIVFDIDFNVKKNDFNLFKYRELSEKYTLDSSLQNIPEDKHFPVIITLISLKCKSLKIDIPTLSFTVTCSFCGEKVPSDDICPNCKKRIKCPGCGATIIKGAQTCTGCGVEINKIDTYLSQIKDTGKELSATKNYLIAEKAIEPVKTIWTKNEPLNFLLTQINSLKNQSIEYEKKLNVLLNERKYFAASALLVEMKQKICLTPQVQELETQIKGAIDNAQKLFNNSANLTVDNQIEAYSRLLSQVSDFQPVINNLKQIKIKMPTLSAELQGTTVLLNWQKLSIPSTSIEYIITRKEKSSPTISDQLIYSGNNNLCNDNNILPGISYFYGLSVKVNIQGIEIQSVSPSISPEILSVSDVSKYNITTGDKYIQIDFDSNASEYLLYRESERGEKIQINDNLRTGKIIDRNVNNGVRYTYTLISIYKKLNGEIIKSSGLKLFATPQTPPKPITSLRFRKEAGEVILSWDNELKETSNIYILYSAIKIDKIAGTIIPLKDLKQAGTVLTTTMPNQAIISLNNDYVKNFFSIWTAYGDNVMFGSEVEIINIVEVSDLKAYLSSGKLYVEWNWPSGCDQVKVSYSNNSSDDAYKTQKNYPKELYDKQKAFVIDTVVDKDYFIEVQTRKFDKNQEILSSGIRTILRNSNPMTIKYTLKVSSFLKKKLTLTVENDNNKSLPKLTLVSCLNQIPARKEDGSVIFVISEGTACGTFELPIEHIRKNYYARLFLSDISIKNIKIVTPDKEHLKLY